MSQFEKILQRRPVVDEAESERVRALAVARLSAMSAHEVASAPPTVTATPPIVVERSDSGEAATVEASDDAATLWEAEPAADAPVEPSALVAVGPGTEVSTTPPEPEAEPAAAPEPAPTAPTEPPVVATAYCPSCAFLLDPAPTEDRACPRCDRAIVVRVLADGRLVYLTEAAIEVFEAERIREENERRWSAEQSVWLELAASVGAAMGRIDRLSRAAPSEAAVTAARDLYLAASEAAAEGAQAGGAWDLAAGLRRSQADDLHRIAGRPMPPDAAVIERYRKAAETELRGIGALARSAALVSARCCEECRADDGTVVRISSEVRRNRLPHPGCPEAPCGCHWDLSPADVEAVVRYLQRTGRPISGT